MFWSHWILKQNETVLADFCLLLSAVLRVSCWNASKRLIWSHLKNTSLYWTNEVKSLKSYNHMQILCAFFLDVILQICTYILFRSILRWISLLWRPVSQWSLAILWRWDINHCNTWRGFLFINELKWHIHLVPRCLIMLWSCLYICV